MRINVGFTPNAVTVANKSLEGFPTKNVTLTVTVTVTVTVTGGDISAIKLCKSTSAVIQLSIEVASIQNDVAPHMIHGSWVGYLPMT